MAEEQARVVLRAILAALGLLLGACGIIVPTTAPGSPGASDSGQSGGSVVTTTAASGNSGSSGNSGGGGNPYGNKPGPLPPVGSSLQVLEGATDLAGAVSNLVGACRDDAQQKIDLLNDSSPPADQESARAALARASQCEKDVQEYFVAMPLVRIPAAGDQGEEEGCRLRWGPPASRPGSLEFVGSSCDSFDGLGAEGSALRRSVVAAGAEGAGPPPSLPPFLSSEASSSSQVSSSSQSSSSSSSSASSSRPSSSSRSSVPSSGS